MARLEGLAAIVTGAARGLGAVFAEALAAEGAQVALADILDAEPAAQRLRDRGAAAVALRADVADPESVHVMVERTLEAFGRIDILVNNAAFYAAIEPQPFDRIDLAEWDRVMQVNVRGPFLCAAAAAPEMRRRGWGRIINMASATVHKGSPNMLHYVTSKGAVLTMTRCLARELGADGICVNSIAPGLTATEALVGTAHWEGAREMVLRARSIRREEVPQDLVGTLLFLASRDSDFMTGQCLVVDGGSVHG